MEVIYTGLHQTPEQSVETGLQEDADAVGLSILSGAHMTLVPRVVELLRAAHADDVLVAVSGNIPALDIPELIRLGVSEVFTPGAATQDIVEFLAPPSRSAVRADPPEGQRGRRSAASTDGDQIRCRLAVAPGRRFDYHLRQSRSPPARGSLGPHEHDHRPPHARRNGRARRRHRPGRLLRAPRRRLPIRMGQRDARSGCRRHPGSRRARARWRVGLPPRHHQQLVGEDRAALRMDVTYTLPHGGGLPTPAVTYTRFRDERIVEYLIYQNPTPLARAAGRRPSGRPRERLQRRSGGSRRRELRRRHRAVERSYTPRTLAAEK